MYRKIVAAGNKITPGEKGKRKKLAESFKEEIAKLALDVDPFVFVNRAFAYCLKHPLKSYRR